MTRSVGMALVLVALGLAACGTSTGSAPRDVAPDGVEAVDPGPALDAVDIAEVPDLAVETTDSSEVVEALDTASDPVCSCTTKDECCDGCHPYAQTKPIACGVAKPCQTRGMCDAGACVGGGQAVACPPAACKAGAGTCNPATNACDYAPGPDGIACEATTGVAGSGLCLGGACVGFGACDARTYGQPAGWPCNFDAECAGGSCRQLGDGWTTWCAAPCGEGKPACADGTACVSADGGASRVCRPIDKDHVLPGDSSLDAFHVCNRNEDCAGALCLSIDGKKFCTRDCGDAGKASDAKCGTCGHCRDNGTDLGFTFQFYCVPEGSLGIGQPCALTSDCSTAFCQDGYCSGQCIVVDGVASCADWQDCVAGVIAASPDISVCVAKGTDGRGLGDPCEGDWSCKTLKCLDVAGTNRCSAECADDKPCAEGTCVDAGSGKRCVPAGEVGAVAEGGTCATPYACATGLSCFDRTCVRACQADSDCTDATCFPDASLQATYCAKACSAQADCPAAMTCWGGRCIVSAHGGTWLLGACRSDSDCETGICRQGTCTDACASDAPCEGSVLVVPQQFGMCSPCDPAKFDADCNAPDALTLNTCVTGVDGKTFCAPPCLGDTAGACPVGTRCFWINGYQQACAPMSGSCSIATACTPGGTCVAPAAAGTPCAADAECRDGPCVDRRCQAATCSADADCGCDLLACNGGACVVPAGGAVQREVEPDDTPAKAQGVAGATIRIAGELYPTTNLPDVDLYRVAMKAGQALDARTHGSCGSAPDTRLRLLAADGTPIPGWENDDVDPQGDLASILVAYFAPADGDVLVEVTQSVLQPGLARVPYLLDLAVYAPPLADTCEGKQPLPIGTTALDLAGATPNYSVSSCTGYAATGRDMAWAVDVPAGSVLTVDLDSTFDGQVYAVTDCADANGTCVQGSDRVHGKGRESLLWENPADPVSGAKQTLHVVVQDDWIEGPTTFTLTAAVNAVTRPANDTVAGAIAITAPGKLSGVTVGATNDYDPGAGTCSAVALPGPDVVYVASVAAHDFWTFGVTAWAGVEPHLWLTTDPADPAACVAAATGFLTHQGGDAPETLYLIVDSATAEAGSSFDLDVEFGAPGPCFGPCDPATFARACHDESRLCTCDAGTKVIAGIDCDQWCKDNGGLSGICHLFTTAGTEGSYCVCSYDCAPQAVSSMCSGLAFTNCTCAAADPCHWQGDGTCDAACADAYPADHFDDPKDCPAGP